MPFVLQCAASHVKEGRDVILVATNRRPSRLLRALEDAGGPIDQRRVFIVDAHSALLGEREPVSYPVEHPVGPDAIVAAMERAQKEHPKAIVLVESLSALIDRSDAATFLVLMPRLLKLAKASQFLAAVFTAWPYDAEVAKALGRFDASIQLRGVEERVVLHNSLAIERTPWGKPVAPTLYKIVPTGGILAYLPKVLVLGPHGAGKTTFVHAVSDKAMSVERMGTTVAMDRGTATIDGVRAEVFGTPGQTRFDPLLPTLAGQAVAAILLIDATKPETFDRAKHMLQQVWRRGLTVVIALNKSDLPGALKPAQARKLLATPDDVDVLTCDSTRAASARKVLASLVERVLTRGAPA